MSKYVRTETGIYNLEEKDEKWQKRCQINDEFEEETYGGRTGRTLYIPPNAILNQADTIEELGDWYVGIDTFGKAHFIEATIPFENVKLCFRGMKINMAILTSKGLIYVAKLNDKGVLELI